MLETARIADRYDKLAVQDRPDGPPEHWTEVLTHLALDHGFGSFLLMGDPDPAALRTFIDDVAPQVRQRVAAARERRPTPSRA